MNASRARRDAVRRRGDHPPAVVEQARADLREYVALLLAPNPVSLGLAVAIMRNPPTMVRSNLPSLAVRNRMLAAAGFKEARS